MAFTGFFAVCGVGALLAACVIGRFLWRDGQKLTALMVGALMATLGLFCLATAWIWNEGLL